MQHQFFINGKRCQVLIDEDSIRWSPVESSSSSREHHKQNNINTNINESSSDINDDIRAEKNIKRVNFDHVIGFKGSQKKCKVYYALGKSNKFSGRLLKLKKLTIRLPSGSESDHQHHNHHNHNKQRQKEQQQQQQKQYHDKQQTQDDADEQAASMILLIQRIDDILNDRRKYRPSRLLIYVNPFGGKGRALHLYKTQVRRLFEIANVEVKLIITKYANHARDTIEDPQFNVEYFDGIICVGGDGMFSELMNGLLFRYNREKILLAQHYWQQTGEQSLDKLRLGLGGIGKKFISPPVPVGVIGAGSTDANSFGLIGTNDVITATLNIILGNQINIDICSIHSIKEDKLLKFVSTFVAYGYFGDVVRESEKLRWLGPSRYDLSGFNNLLKNKTYNGLVRILISHSDGTPSESTRCHANCKLCHFDKQQQQQQQEAEACKQQRAQITATTATTQAATDSKVQSSGVMEKFDDFELIEKSGSFVGVNAAVTACRCPQTKKGFSPNNHLANGCADLILVLACTRFQYIRYLLRTGFTSKSAFDLDYVEAYRCRQFEFVADDNNNNKPNNGANGGQQEQQQQEKQQPQQQEEQPWSSNSLDSSLASGPSSSSSSTSASSWNADGEVLEEQSIRVKVNNQLLRVFGTGEPW